MNLTRRDLYALGILVAFALAFFLNIPHQAVTGDEPRYVLFSASLWNFSTFVMPADEWVARSTELLGYPMEGLPPLGSGGAPSHPIYMAIILSPLAAFGTEGLRAAGLIAGLIGAAFVYFACRRVADLWPSIFAASCALGLFPLAPYVHSYWIEVFIFAGIAAGIALLPLAGRSMRGDLLCAAVILIIPFIHLRAAVIGATIFAAFFLRVYNAVGLDYRRLAPLAIMAIVFCLALVGLNTAIHGSPTGSVTTARPPFPSELFDVVATNLVTIKGVLPYAPIWLLGYAGLVAGAVRRDRFVLECGVFALIALATSIGVNPGEGWPGRFLIASVPILAVGLTYWIARTEHWSQLLLALLLFGVSALHTVVFTLAPNKYIENRQSDVVFQMIFDKLGGLNFGLYAPIEGIDIGLARAVLFVVIAMIAAAAASIIKERAWLSGLCLAVTIALFDLTRAAEIPVQPTYSGDTLKATFPTKPLQVSLSIGRRWEGWYSPPWPLFVSSGEAGGFLTQDTLPANPIVPEECFRGIEALSIQSSGLDIEGQAKYEVRAFESWSILYRSYIKIFQVCD